MDVQKAGDNAQQTQIGSVVIYQGIDEKRAREIFDDKFELVKRDFAAEAYATINNRQNSFLSVWEDVLRANPGILKAFADPSFLLLLPRAARTAATTDKVEDFKLLSNLLAKRAEESENNYAKTGIRKAISIIEEISDEALLGLTLAHAILYYSPKGSDVSECLSVLDEYYGHLMINKLPQGRSWIDQLDLLDAVRIDEVHGFLKYDDILSDPIRLGGIINIGFKVGSPELETANKILNDFSLPNVFIADNPLLSGYVRLRVTNESEIDNYLIVAVDHGRQITMQMTQGQKDALHRIYNMQIKDSQLSEQVKAAFDAECAKYPNVAKVRMWWNQIVNSFDITAAGKVLAFANSQRRDSQTPMLDFKTI